MIAPRLLVSTALLMLASCGSGGGGNGGGPSTGITPTPSSSAPTPAPSTPTPSPSYSTFAALTGAQSYSSGCVSFAPVGSGVPGLQSNFSYQLNSGQVSYNPAGETFTILGTSFGSTNRISGSLGGTSVYSKPDPASGATLRFDLVQPVPGVYSRTASMLVQGQGRGSYCVLGVPTLNTDIPAGPTVTFTTFAVRGRAFVKRPGGMIEYDLSPSTATLVVDLTTGQFTSQLNLVGSNGGSNTVLGTHDIAGSLTEANSGLVGSQATMPTPAPLPGTGGVIVMPIRVEGGFFGPKGVEFAYIFSRQERENTSAQDVSYSFFGTVAGSR